MPTLRRITALAAFCAAAFLAAPALLSAEDAAGQAAPAAQPADAKAAAPCPYSENGSCCATCQDKAKQAAQAAPAAAAQQAAPAAEEHGDCPCKRAAAAKAKAKL